MTPDRVRATERELLQAAIDSLRDLLFTVYMPGDFGARARALIADMQDERRRRATDVLPDPDRLQTSRRNRP